MQRLIFFPGPPKTATTWFYDLFKQHPEIHVVGGKESYSYKKNLLLTKNIQKKIIAVFDHNLLIDNYSQAINQNNGEAIIVIRDPYERALSAIKYSYRTGIINKKKLANIKDIEDIWEKFYERGNYYQLTKNLIKNKTKILFIKFENLHDEKNLTKKLSNYLSISNNFKLPKTKNEGGYHKFSLIIKLAKNLLRPLLINFNDGLLWTSIKKFFNLHLPKREFSPEEIKLLESKININKCYKDHKKFLSNIKNIGVKII